LPERRGDAASALRDPPVEFPYDDDLQGTASLHDARRNAHRADRREAADHGGRRHAELREPLGGLDSIEQRHDCGPLLRAVSHDGGGAPSAHRETAAGSSSTILVPSTWRNLAIHAGWAGHAGAVTRLPSATAWSMPISA